MKFYLLSQLSVLAADSVKPTDSSDFSPKDFFWLPLIIGLSIFMLLATWRRVRRSQERDNLTVKERVSNVMPKGNEVYSQIGDLMAELADLSRQINGQIDTRIAKLDQLNTQADETIKRLQKLLEQSPGKLASSSAVDEVARRTDVPAAEPNRSPIEDQETRNILGWADQGRSTISIAQELNRPVGEIELILALNKK